MPRPSASPLTHEPLLGRGSDGSDVSEVDDETRELELFSGGRCCSYGKLYKLAMWVLCVVDWLHIFLAMLAMGRMGWDSLRS